MAGPVKPAHHNRNGMIGPSRNSNSLNQSQNDEFNQIAGSNSQQNSHNNSVILDSEDMHRNPHRNLNKFNNRVTKTGPASPSPSSHLNLSGQNMGPGSRQRAGRPGVTMIDREQRSSVTPMNDSLSTSAESLHKPKKSESN